MKVDVVVYDGVDELDVIGPLEVLRCAESLGAEVTVHLVTAPAKDSVTGSYQLRFEPDSILVPGDADILIVPGGGWATRSPQGAWGEVQRGDLLPSLAQAAQSTRIMAGVCTGTLLLAHAGIVGNRRATTHHAAQQDLADLGATLVSDRVVDDGSLVTSGGVTSGIDLALWLVEREFSATVADAISARLEYPRTRPTDR